jgi:hypothetical protein
MLVSMSCSNVGTIKWIYHRLPLRSVCTLLQPCTIVKTRRSIILPNNWPTQPLTTLSTCTCTSFVKAGQVQYNNQASSGDNGRRRRESSPNEFELNVGEGAVYTCGNNTLRDH